KALREMLSRGRISKVVTIKIDGALVAVTIKQEGPIAFTESTTLSNLFDEDKNRCLLTSTDEGPDQTRRILDRQADRAKDGVQGFPTVVGTRHHVLQRILARDAAPVVIPFASRLAARFPTNRVEARRTFPMLLSVIEASALLHLYQRESNSDG